MYEFLERLKMNQNKNPSTPLWLHPQDDRIVQVINQRFLPFELKILDIKTCDGMFVAIRDMVLRGAPLIGVAAAYGIYLGLVEGREKLFDLAKKLKSARPTAVNLAFIIDHMVEKINLLQNSQEQIQVAKNLAEKIRQNEIYFCDQIGEHGLPLIEKIYAKKKQPVQILTHCNAGWLACIKWGTATAPIYKAHQKGLPVHVWVDETRPRNQGARLTAWELQQAGVPFTVIPDNTGGHLMQQGLVDLVIVGSDRTTRKGDVANKIGTYLKALAAHDNDIPFYVALPSTSIDWNLRDGSEIPIEERGRDEVEFIEGWHDGQIKKVRLIPEKAAVTNYGFDVTPARLVTGIITERGVCEASEPGLLKLFPEKI